MTLFELKTKYAFGNDAINYLAKYLKEKNCKNALLLYGTNSIKTNNLYNLIIANLKDANCNFIEASGITANPLASLVYKIANDNRNKNIDIVIAAGGGSIIDASKVIAALIANPDIKDIPDLMNIALNLTKSIPIIAIPTTASTGSENNIGSVITLDHIQPHLKSSVYLPCELPVLAIEDTKYLASASDWQIAAGIYDTFCHNIEQYFGQNTFGWTKQYLFSNIRNILKYGPLFLKDKNNEQYQENVMWTSSMSLNSLSRFQTNGYWTIHLIEHGISGVWNVTHGAGNALITISYLKHACTTSDEFKEQALSLAKEVFGVGNIDALLEKISGWIKILKLPTRWSDFKEIGKKPTEEMLKNLTNHILSNRLSKRLPKKFNNYDFIYQVLNDIE